LKKTSAQIQPSNMNKSILVLISLFFVNFVQAQQTAVTETGEQVILFKDGTWKYQNEEKQTETEIPTNSIAFKKEAESTFLLKSNKVNVGFWLNPKMWTFKKGNEKDAAEYKLQLKAGDLYGMIISEKVEIPLETLKSIALNNGRKAAPDLKITKEEYRIVNGLKVLLLQMNGTMEGIKFSYYGYYFSNTNGTVQFVTYTSTNLIASYLPKIEVLLNGIVELN
jgi:hypothetical protein